MDICNLSTNSTISVLPIHSPLTLRKVRVNFDDREEKSCGCTSLCFHVIANQRVIFKDGHAQNNSQWANRFKYKINDVCHHLAVNVWQPFCKVLLSDTFVCKVNRQHHLAAAYHKGREFVKSPLFRHLKV